jgi:hypothetical protein
MHVQFLWLAQQGPTIGISQCGVLSFRCTFVDYRSLDEISMTKSVLRSEILIVGHEVGMCTQYGVLNDRVCRARGRQSAPRPPFRVLNVGPDLPPRLCSRTLRIQCVVLQVPCSKYCPHCGRCARMHSFWPVHTITRSIRMACSVQATQAGAPDMTFSVLGAQGSYFFARCRNASSQLRASRCAHLFGVLQSSKWRFQP